MTLAIINLIDMSFLEDCPNELSINRINFSLIVLMNLRDGAYYIMFLSLLIFCTPVILYQVIVTAIRNRRNRNVRREVALKVFSMPYDKLRDRENRGELPGLDQAECIICMEGYVDAEGNVLEASPLMCHFTHVYHLECIKAWMVRNNSCPQCKEAVT